MSTQNTAWMDHVDQRTDAIVENLIAERDRLAARVKELEAAGDAIVADNRDMGNLTRWHRAREGKP